MRVQELRIGNLLLAHGNIRCVKSITEEIQNGINRGEYQPIPLTEEWLVKFGFRQQKFGYFRLTYYEKNNIVYCYTDNQVELDQPNTYLTKVYYVHQLQNLYFSLTGEELTIKE